MPTAAILLIGNELLSGRTQDKNLAWLASQLGSMGVAVAEARVIADIPDTIITTVNELRARHDYVLTTGGIGPTHDDITAENVAAAFGVALQEDPAALAALVRHYGGTEHVTDARRRMARVPQGAQLLENPVSGAPGFRIGNVIVLPGVPHIMQAIFASAAPGIQGGPPLQSRAVSALGLGESYIAAALADIAARFPTLSIGSYPFYRPPEGYGTSLIARGTDSAALDAAQSEIAAAVRALGREPILREI